MGAVVVVYVHEVLVGTPMVQPAGAEHDVALHPAGVAGTVIVTEVIAVALVFVLTRSLFALVTVKVKLVELPSGAEAGALTVRLGFGIAQAGRTFRGETRSNRDIERTSDQIFLELNRP